MLKGFGAGLDAAKAAASTAASKIAESESFNAAKDATKAAASKVSDKVAQSDIYHGATHQGMSKEAVQKLHISRKDDHSKLMTAFLSSGEIIQSA